VIPSPVEESIQEIWVDLVDGTGMVSMDISYYPDKDELARREKERVEREKSIRNTTSEYDFLY